MRLDDAGPRTWLLATAAGWAVLAWALALAGMGGRVAPLADDPGLVRPLPPLRAATASRLGPLEQYSEIGTRPLFAVDRRPKAFSLQGDAEGADAAAFDFVLTSVLITPQVRLAILQPPDGSQSLRVKLGDAPESHPAWRLSAVNARSAVFDGPEGQRTMELRVFDGQGGQPPTAVAREGQPPVRPAGVPAGGAVPIEPPPSPTMVAPSAPKPVTATPRPATTPATKPQPSKSSNTDPMLTEQAQMEAIRQRIQARREQLRQQSQPPPQPPDNSR
ncbi:hypothetical protein ACFQZQ_07365 [Lysobacter koreensis]|uniref:General secretion pathway protein GspN n=1 Tax=Lysobacter koreensis TaxID=266122 RepID=A0ABW2YRI1_9GAMM